jgi:Mg-chelatase subunit ChlD
LAFAAGRPEVVARQTSHGRHVVFVVDVSESATRDRAAWQAALRQAALATSQPGKEAESDADREADIASLIVFAASDEVIVRAKSIAEVRQLLRDPDRLSRQSSRPDPDGSVPAAALADALDLITRAARPGEIIVISDGLWTSASPDAEVHRAAAEGVPIHVFPLDAGPPARGIVAAHLARTVDSGAEAPLRLIVAGGGAADAATLGVSRLREAPQTHPIDGAATATPLRITERFEGRGLQFVEVTLAGRSGRRQLRRLYTTVVGPPRLLVLGKAPWISDLPRERFDIRRIDDPRQAFDPRETDVIIIDGLFAQELNPQTPARIAEAVAQNGIGLFLINGRLRGSVRDETVIKSYAATPLAPLLPVTADPDLAQRDPPPQTVALVIDVSGSMGIPDGAPQRMAQALARQILGQMRERDQIIIDTFPRVEGAILNPLRLTAEARQQAERYIDSLYASGGSDAGAGVDLVSRLQGTACAAFIITDGDVVGTRMFVPGCNLSYLEIGTQQVFVNHDLSDAARRNGQAEKIAPGGPVPRLSFRFFNPDKDKIFFREGRIDVASRIHDPTVAPLLPVDGVAISHAFPEAEVLLFRDAWPADPVLAFRRPSDGRGGETGVFMSALDRWMSHPDGKEAIMRHLLRLSSWQDREHYEIAIAESLGHGRLTVFAVGEEGRILEASSLSVVLELEGGGSDPVPLAPVPGEAGALSGTFELPDRGLRPGDRVVRGHLRVSEPGRPAQRIPVALPVTDGANLTGTMAEAFTGGQDRAALASIAERTHGEVAPNALTRPSQPPAPPPQPRHQAPLALAAMFAVIAFLSRGSRL